MLAAQPISATIDQPAGFRRHARTCLLATLAALAFVWLVLLPWLSRQPAVREHIHTQERQGINPSALYYTDLEILPPIVHRIERMHESPHDPFWSLAPAQ
jgi:hypothetical protein